MFSYKTGGRSGPRFSVLQGSSREIATGYLDHWLPMGATLAIYDTGYLYLVQNYMCLRFLS